MLTGPAEHDRARHDRDDLPNHDKTVRPGGKHRRRIGGALGRSLRFEEIDAVGAAELLPGMPAEMVTSIAEGHAALVAYPEPVTDTVDLLTGRLAVSFAQWAKDHVADFAGPAR